MFNRFYWAEKIQDETLRKNVQAVLEACGRLASFNRMRMETERSDYEGARMDFRTTVEEIHAQPPKEIDGKKHDQLWDSMMTIRPAMISARVPKRFIFLVSQELWGVAQTARKNQELQKAEFFEKLQKQMQEKSIICWRALMSGGVVVERKKDGENIINILHTFPIRIPREIAQEVGLKLTTKIDNIQAHKSAVTKMRERGLVPEKVGEAIQIQAEDLYNHLEKGRTQ